MSIAEALKVKHGSKHLSMIVNAEGKVVQVPTIESFGSLPRLLDLSYA